MNNRKYNLLNFLGWNFSANSIFSLSENHCFECCVLFLFLSFWCQIYENRGALSFIFSIFCQTEAMYFHGTQL